ncbi:folylpolyglutamate synthase [Recurvomyces mirabilis]|nr:folylpolyglutamate synthase [Recurvomyces mirabilis]
MACSTHRWHERQRLRLMLDLYNDSNYRKEMNQPRLSHARFMSPHWIDRWDCIIINQKTVPFKLFDHIERQVLKRNDREGIDASEFELLTATAFEIFNHEKVDIGVVEVGMGGRLDATNVIGQMSAESRQAEAGGMAFRAPPLVTAITAVGLDHQGFLGNTLTEIARQKAGIIKPGIPVVYDASNDIEVQDVIKAQAQDSRVVQWQSPSLPVAHLAYDSSTPFDRRNLFWSHHESQDLPIYYRDNFSVAFRTTLTALQELRLYPREFKQKDKPDVVCYPHESMSAMVEGLEDHLPARELATAMLNLPLSTVPGRLQKIDLRPLGIPREENILLDGAHNPQAAKVLEMSLVRGVQNADPIVWVLAFTSTKEVDDILGIILRPGDTVIAVEFGPVDGMPWVEPMKSADIVKTVKTVDECNPGQAFGSDLLGALRAAHEVSIQNGGLDHQLPIVIAGSLYLVGDVLRLLRAAESKAKE